MTFVRSHIGLFAKLNFWVRVQLSFFFLLVQKPFGKRERLKETMTDAMESFGGER